VEFQETEKRSESHSLGSDFLALTTKAQAKQEKKYTDFKLKAFMLKRHQQKSKNTTYRLREYFCPSCILIRDLYLEYKNELLQLSKKANNPIKNEQRAQINTSPKETYK
jgi:hypothetical protein